ncbi:MAG TPA: NHL repeat-containing protein [Bryobacteraceae bacterium]|nr:NHL repeat-containing protein [Bryobacteraceae bacterium]
MWIADARNNRVLLIQYNPPLVPTDPYLCPPAPQSCNANYGSPVFGDPQFGIQYKNGVYPGFGSTIGVIGQPNFTSKTQNLSRTGLEFPSGIGLDSSGNLWVVDQLNSRVLEFQASDIRASNFKNGPAAQQVIGAPDYTTANDNPNAQSNNFGAPEAIAFDSGGNLYVSDTGNCRIMVFGHGDLGAGKPNQPAARIVLGQSNFTSSCVIPTSGSVLGRVNGIAFDKSGNLWAASSTGVSEFTTQAQGVSGINFQNGQMGTVVIPTGQILSSPFGVTFDPDGNLWVSDGCNLYLYCSNAYNRVIELKSGSWTPISILGQGSSPQTMPGDPTNSEANEGKGNPYPSTLASPNYLTFDSSKNLFVSDSGNNRVNEYDPVYAQTPPACSPGSVCVPCPKSAKFCLAQGTIYVGDNATFIIGETNGYTVCNGLPEAPCPTDDNGLPIPSPPTKTTLNQPKGIIAIAGTGG